MQAERDSQACAAVGSGGSPTERGTDRERATAAGGEEAEPVVVRGNTGVGSLASYLLSGERELPAVGIARSLEEDEPVLSTADVRAIVGAGPRIYYLPDEEMLEVLEGLLGRVIALPAGGVRVWWPALSVQSVARDHPFVLAHDCESPASVLEEFAKEFDLSRPRVRREIRVIERLHRLAERELTEAQEENRALRVERYEAIRRAEAAEARLRDATPQPPQDSDLGQDES
jgi:hypothetical protein